MNKYDFSFFDCPIDRCGTATYKWDMLHEREKCDLLPMWVADMDFRCADEVSEAIIRRAQHPVFGYTTQTDSAVQAMLDFLLKHDGIALTKGQQAILPGVVPGLRTAVNVFTEPGEGVLIQPPVYGPFFAAVRQNGRKLVENPLITDAEGRYQMDFDGMEKAFQGGVRLALLCSPHNPVARVWSRQELDKVYALCKQYGVTLVVDEIHRDFVYEKDAFTTALKLDEAEDANIIVLTSAGKTFNLAGLQQGALLTRNAAAKERMVRHMHRMGVEAGNIFAMTATEAAYRDGEAWFAGLMAYLDAARKMLKDELTKRLPKAIMAEQEATYLAWLDLRAYGFSTAELMRRTHQAGVAFNPGTDFDPRQGEGFLRFNFGCPHNQTLDALNRLEKAIKQS